MKFDIPVFIQTRSGHQYAEQIKQEYFKAERQGYVEDMKIDLRNGMIRTERDILHFLDDPDMMKSFKLDEEDVEGWELFKEMSDRYSILKHYYTR